TVAMKVSMKILIGFCFFIVPSLIMGQELYSTTFLKKDITPKNIKHYSQTALKLSKNGDAYFLMNLRAYLGANNEIIRKTESEGVIDYQRTLIDNIINAAQPSKDILHNASPYLDRFK